ncbi:hypothetical protein [Methylorubrum sp. SL192]|uniref:hypothetical protein n=1 Tax=Methylorubrum sp. SL192 TaxID=2995167 RepID=UPI002272E47F|nr:hypothetical protein [Methylorubrum sp. SL192]MCY1643257.1 hypothetical protein [Methylorubrum sp. SL192]
MLIGNCTRNINKETRLYYVHVPKTGGTTINVLFRNIFGELRSLTHAESMLIAPATREVNAEVCREYNFVSAHLPRDFYNVHFKPFGYKAIVTLREPVEHFVSFVLWFARSTHTIVDANLNASRLGLREDPNAFFQSATMEQLEFCSGQQSKAVFGSDRTRLPLDAQSRTSYLLAQYDTIILTEDISRLGDHIKLNDRKLSFSIPHENMQPDRPQSDIIITDKIRELLLEDLLIYDEVKKINQISNSYWQHLTR